MGWQWLHQQGSQTPWVPGLKREQLPLGQDARMASVFIARGGSVSVCFWGADCELRWSMPISHGWGDCLVLGFFFVLLLLWLLVLLFLLRLCHSLIRFQFYAARSCMDLRAGPEAFAHFDTDSRQGHVETQRKLCAAYVSSLLNTSNPCSSRNGGRALLPRKFKRDASSWSCSTVLLRCTKQWAQAKHAGLQLWLVDSLWFFKTTGWVRASHGVVAS